MPSLHKIWRSRRTQEPKADPREPSDEAKDLLYRAQVHEEQGRDVEAIEAYEKALKEYSDTVGLDDGKTLAIREPLALLYCEAGETSRAEAEIAAVYAAQKRVSGLSHRRTLHVASSYGRILIRSRKLVEARDVIEKTLKAFQDNDDRDCREKYVALVWIGDVLRLEDRPEDAIAVYNRALAGFERLVGPDHSLSLDTKWEIASACSDLGNFLKAATLQENVVIKLEQTMRAGHPKVIAAMINLGRVYINLQRMKEAETILTRGLTFYSESSERSEQYAKELAFELVRLYTILGRADAAASVQAWSRGDDVELPGLKKSALESKELEIEQISEPIVLSEARPAGNADGDSGAFNREMNIRTSHGTSHVAICLLDTQCQNGNWISKRLVERLEITDQVSNDVATPSLTSGTGQDVEAIGAIEIQWSWHPNGTRMYHALFFVFTEGSHLDVIIGVEYIVREDLVRANKPAFVPLTEHRTTTQSDKAAIAIEKEKQRQAKENLKAHRAAKEAAQQANQQASTQAGSSQQTQ